MLNTFSLWCMYIYKLEDIKVYNVLYIMHNSVMNSHVEKLFGQPGIFEY